MTKRIKFTSIAARKEPVNNKDYLGVPDKSFRYHKLTVLMSRFHSTFCPTLLITM